MDRVHYRRVAPSRMRGDDADARRDSTRRDSARRGDGENAEPTMAETLILQSIVCGVILVFVLLVSLVNIAPTEAVRGGLRTVLTGADTPRELLQDVRHIGEEFFGFGPSHETEPESFHDNFPEYSPTGNDSYPPAAIFEVPNLQYPGPLEIPEL